MLFTIANAILFEALEWLGWLAEMNESNRGVCLDDESPILIKKYKMWYIRTQEKLKNWNMEHQFFEEKK